MKYKVEVKTRNEPKWSTNNTRFDTHEEAVRYARDLYARWNVVEKWRIVIVPDGTTMTVGEIKQAFQGVPDDVLVSVCLTSLLALTQHDIYMVLADDVSVCLFPREM